ncbi:hypothetical protein OY671_012191, partial [Metschnikowia pulcherrima]
APGGSRGSGRFSAGGGHRPGPCPIPASLHSTGRLPVDRLRGTGSVDPGAFAGSRPSAYLVAERSFAGAGLGGHDAGHRVGSNSGLVVPAVCRRPGGRWLSRPGAGQSAPTIGAHSERDRSPTRPTGRAAVSAERPGGRIQSAPGGAAPAGRLR